MKRLTSILFIVAAFAFAFVRLVPLSSFGPNPDDRRPPDGWPQRRIGGGPGGPGGQFPGPGGPRFGGFRGGRGPGGPPSGFQVPLKLVAQFDQNGDGWLNADERKSAREFLEKERAEGRGRRGPGLRIHSDGAATSNGPRLTPAEVKSFPTGGLYDLPILRTVFIDFEDIDWEKELSEFYHTDVEVPARITVDGKTYPDVGVHFRGASSFFTVGAGRKHSINLSLDMIQKDQDLYGYRTLNLLNSNEDPTFLRSVLYLAAARDYIPAPKANFMRVVINGESWGIYVNAQQFNKDFVRDWFGTTKGARWKVPGSPRGRGGLEYFGEKTGEYRKIYDLKTKDDKKSWHGLIELCRVLNETSPEKLEEELQPLLDIDGALKFLALENALINSDGYWIRASDYNLYREESGRFHVIPHDANETYRVPEGPGLSSEGRGVDLDPFRGVDDPARPLISKLLAVPALRAKYVAYEREIAAKWLDWDRLAPMIDEFQRLIAADVQKDTHKLYSSENFGKAVTEETEHSGARGPQRTMGLKEFVQERQKFLLNHPGLK